MTKHNNKKNVHETVFEFLQSDKAPERAAIIRRMIEFLIGGRIMPLNTRARLFIFYSVFATTATSWWYWLRQVDRYRVETMLEQGLYEYDEKGKVVETAEFVRAYSSPDMVTKVAALNVQKRVDQLERHIAEYKEEREMMKELIENQKRIEIKLQTIEDTLNSRK